MSKEELKNQKWVKCPYCSKEQKTNKFTKSANCCGVWVKCKNPTCKAEFEIKIINGEQI